MTEPLQIVTTINGVSRSLTIAPNLVVADLLREQLALTGCKIGCDQAVCGSCTVLVDDMPMAACATFAFELDGKSVTTIEGLSADGSHPVQQAFLRNSAFQCGFCTPGMILSVVALLKLHPNPNDSTIREWLNANICRCTGYQAIVDAVRQAASMAQKNSEAGKHGDY
jgi:aerobic-type carbon monoxide dehydrogenase small subunit (CoxS/CutS family)